MSEVHKISYWIPSESRASIVNWEVHKRKGFTKRGMESRLGKIHRRRTTAKIPCKIWMTQKRRLGHLGGSVG